MDGGFASGQMDQWITILEMKEKRVQLSDLLPDMV